jgi:hypothetical protein
MDGLVQNIVAMCGLVLVVLWCVYSVWRQHRRGGGASPSEEAIGEFAANAQSFIGLYEPMRMIRDGELTFGEGVFADWGACVDSLDAAPALAAYWDSLLSGYGSWDEREYIKKARNLLVFAGQAGIVRSSETEVTVDAGVLMRYIVKDDASLEPGTVAKVETPCWTVNGNVLEKGVLSPGEPI